MASTDEPNRNAKYDPKKPHITELPITASNWYKHVNWLNVILIVGIPIYGMVMSYWTPLQWKTAVWAFAYYFMTGLGITAGKGPHHNYPETPFTNEPQVTIASGLTAPTVLLCRSRSSLPLSAVAPLKGRSDGGPETTVLTTDIPTPTRIHIPSARVFSTPTSAGWS
jgi:stearoyl-CoA desaturase (delta-9 desaturase)